MTFENAIFDGTNIYVAGYDGSGYLIKYNINDSSVIAASKVTFSGCNYLRLLGISNDSNNVYLSANTYTQYNFCGSGIGLGGSDLMLMKIAKNGVGQPGSSSPAGLILENETSYSGAVSSNTDGSLSGSNSASDIIYNDISMTSASYNLSISSPYVLSR
jgi:hypothetical protein